LIHLNRKRIAMKLLKCRITVTELEESFANGKTYEYEAPEGFATEVGRGILFYWGWVPDYTRSFF